MKIAIVNGPNLNLTGVRQPEVYGTESFDAFLEKSRVDFPWVEVLYFQSNVEGELMNILHKLNEDDTLTGILLNAGGYTHTSVALGDAVAAIRIPVIEIHMSNTFAREDFRHVSYIGRAAMGSIVGFGMDSYRLGIVQFLHRSR